MRGVDEVVVRGAEVGGSDVGAPEGARVPYVALCRKIRRRPFR